MKRQMVQCENDLTKAKLVLLSKQYPIEFFFHNAPVPYFLSPITILAQRISPVTENPSLLRTTIDLSQIDVGAD